MPARKWSQDVTEHSNALDLDEGVFTLDDPTEIARSLKQSAERSKRRKGTPLQSAMSMLNFYINRAGDTCRRSDAASSKPPRTSCARRSAARMEGTLCNPSRCWKTAQRRNMQEAEQ
jgi:hypothetical protein